MEVNKFCCVFCCLWPTFKLCCTIGYIISLQHKFICCTFTSPSGGNIHIFLAVGHDRMKSTIPTAYCYSMLYLLCSIYSLQSQLLHQDSSKGIIMSTQSLVLQKVSRETVGDYVCRAVNTEGSGESNPVALKIMCK